MKRICAGRTLLYRPPGVSKPHLWLVLTDPEGQDQYVLAVMLRTATEHTDSTVILQPGDHPFVRHPSSVDYSEIRRFKLSSILRAVAIGDCHPRESLSRALLKKVQAGLLLSPHTVHALKDYWGKRFPS